jgi:hypothetical protein
MIAVKRCSRCRVFKTFGEFPYGSGTGGRGGYCTPCAREYRAERDGRPAVKARDAVRAKAYARAVAVLRERHHDEFREIYEQAWRHEAHRAELP